MPESTQAKIHDAAMIAHEANRAYCLTIGDSSQPDWKSAENWQRDSAIAGAEAIWNNPSTTPEQSHEQWSAHKIADGWVYGPVKDPVAKTHPCLVPYDELPIEQQVKDALFGSVVRAVLVLPAPVNLANYDVVSALLHESTVSALEAEIEVQQKLVERLRAETPAAPKAVNVADATSVTVPTESEGGET